jgi:hypothetical protein
METLAFASSSRVVKERKTPLIEEEAPFQNTYIVLERTTILSHVTVTIDGVWIGNWIY